jgi:hypothetical protein
MLYLLSAYGRASTRPRNIRMYFGDSKIFFQFMGLYSVSSGVVSFLWPLSASVSMSPSRFFLNHIASLVCVYSARYSGDQTFATAVSGFSGSEEVGRMLEAETTWTNTSRVETRSFGVSGFALKLHRPNGLN